MRFAADGLLRGRQLEEIALGGRTVGFKRENSRVRSKARTDRSAGRVAAGAKEGAKEKGPIRGRNRAFLPASLVMQMHQPPATTCDNEQRGMPHNRMTGIASSSDAPLGILREPGGSVPGSRLSCG